MRPLASTATPSGMTNGGVPAGAALADTVVRAPVTGSTRRTSGSPRVGDEDAAAGIDLDVDRAVSTGGPAGALFDETSVRTPVAGLTRMMSLASDVRDDDVAVGLEIDPDRA